MTVNSTVNMKIRPRIKSFHSLEYCQPCICQQCIKILYLRFLNLSPQPIIRIQYRIKITHYEPWILNIGFQCLNVSLHIFHVINSMKSIHCSEQKPKVFILFLYWAVYKLRTYAEYSQVYNIVIPYQPYPSFICRAPVRKNLLYYVWCSLLSYSMLCNG